MNTYGPMAKFCPVPREDNDMESHERTEKCKEVFALLSEYLNLELPPDACQEIGTHLAGCPVASSLPKAFARPWSSAAVTGRPNCRSPWKERAGATPRRLPKDARLSEKPRQLWSGPL